jgi:undecaprenyl-diphosphatase
MNEVELPLYLAFNRASRRQAISAAFAVISRLGDGVLWYSIMLALPFIYGMQALQVSVHMLLVGVVSLLLYKWLKPRTSRRRPYALHTGIEHNVRALDEFSFPSGHTMHAVGFSIVLLAYYPDWGWLVLPFTALVACSRLVLGLHYPSDVAAGAAIGASVALVSLNLL